MKKRNNWLQDFENCLNPINQSSCNFDMEILGYGEISTVFSISNNPEMAFKRLPVFTSLKQTEEYGKLYEEYNAKLEALTLQVPAYSSEAVSGHKDVFVAYLAQRKLNKNSIGHKVIHKHSKEEVLILFKLVATEMLKIWENNSRNEKFKLGLDSQISNWAVKDYDEGKSKITQKTELLFIDTSTPFIRKNNEEQLDAELLLLSAPAFARPLLRKFFVQDILDRYYDFRLVSIDLLANLYKEQLPEYIPGCLAVINSVIENNKEILTDSTKITLKEVKAYYKEDKFIWQLFMAVRKIDRFISTKVLKKRYEFILPGPIKR